MTQDKLHKIAFLGGAIFNTIIWVGIAIIAYHKGYSNAIKDVQASITIDKKTLNNHAKEIQNITSESDTMAVYRFRKNFGTDSSGNSIRN